MSIHEVRGNLFLQNWQSIVITVNLVGAMGAGVARVCRDMSPETYRWYRELCRKGQFNIGDIKYYTQHDGRTFILFPTKIDWKNDSKIEYIESSLQTLAKTYQYHHVDSIHMPKPGCRNGGLEWKDVRPLVYQYLDNLDIDVTVMI